MNKINRSEIYDKNLNFLIGSGASVGLLPTLALGIKDSVTRKQHTVETLAKKFEGNDYINTALFSWYVENVIKPAAEYSSEYFERDRLVKGSVEHNYEMFMTTILTLLSKKPNRYRANIFTTNYDGMIAHTAESLLRTGNRDFVLNDGGMGFVKRMLSARTFGRYCQDEGVFGRYARKVPQINLIQLHGSVYWYEDGDNIEISYDKGRALDRVELEPPVLAEDFEALIGDGNKTEGDIQTFYEKNKEIDLPFFESDMFWKEYNNIPIVNPTKWKFHETVFEEHYYQMLRLLSYELEKPNTAFIIFGFSFADEHILNLVRRSLSNPSLHLYVCCFDQENEMELREKFLRFPNVEFITIDEDLNFTAFNEQVFSATSMDAEATDT